MRKGGSRKPNRCGGKFNKPRTLPPSKSSERKEDPKGRKFEDDEFLQPRVETRDYGLDNSQAEHHSKQRFGLRPPKNQARIQRLQMSNENQEMVLKVLQQLEAEGLREKNIRKEDFSHGKSYNPREAVKNERYWKRMEDQRLVVEEAVGSKKDEEIANKFAMSKLLKCGFEEKRCISALKNCSDDVGAALEKLIVQSCCVKKLAKESQASSEDLINEAKIQRNEEALALESIYGENFNETISNRIWVIKLTLEYIMDYFKQEKRRNNSDLPVSRPEKIPRNLCKFFLKGNCKFGSKCRMSHQLQERETADCLNQENIDGTNLTNESTFHLEIRFPEGSLYPYEIPVIAFYSVLDTIPSHVSLNIMLRLTEEAKTLAEDGVPAVFTLVSFLEDKEQVLKLLSSPPSEFSLREVKKKVLDEQREGNEGAATELGDDSGFSKTKNGKLLDPLKQEEKEKLNRKMKQQFQKLQSVPAYKNMLEERKKLPAWKSQNEILDALEEHQVVVISGMTGCGKTTQIPQFILDSFLKTEKGSYCFIVCTQPRRISATSVAERVASERAEKIGNSVGYQIRLESKQSSSTRLLFCTTGILLRRLEGEATLPGVSHVIVDEVHERTEESDFLMMVLRGLIAERPDLRVVLMSATLNAELFSNYFFNAPVVHIPGRTFPVDQFFIEDVLEMTGYQVDPDSQFARPVKRTNAVPMGLGSGDTMKSQQLMKELKEAAISSKEANRLPNNKVKDQNLSEEMMAVRYAEYSERTITSLCTMDHEKTNYDLIVSLLQWIVDGHHKYPTSAAVLVFLPGMGEIMTLYEQLQNHRTFNPKESNRFRIIPLHSSLSSEEQSIVFKKPPDGVTKIVLSTNIAETSVTIDDIVYVIDSGKMKENRYDSSKGMESLEETWVSRANARQRKGRAGRVTSGVCFHLFTRNRFEHHMAEHQLPEIKRVPLEKLCLRIKILGIFFGRDVKEVLSNLLEPPEENAIADSIARLHSLGALDSYENLTSLGFHLAALPVDVRIGKLMLFGAIFRCLDPVLTIAASLSYRSPFSAPFDKRDEADKKRSEMAVGNSDHLTLLAAYKRWTETVSSSLSAGYQYCHEHYLSVKTLQMIASLKCQFAELLSDIGFISSNLTSRKMEKIAPRTGDGVRAATGEEVNCFSENQKLIVAVLCAALYPNVVQIVSPETTYVALSSGAVAKDAKAIQLKFWTKSDGQVFIHPKSVNFQVNFYESPFLVYHEKVKTSKVYVRDTSMVSVYSLLLFCGDSLSIDLEKGMFVVAIDDGWIRFTSPSLQVALIVRDLREELDRLLSEKIESPGMDLLLCPRGSRIIDTIVRLITTQ